MTNDSMHTDQILALAAKPGDQWTDAEEHAAHDLLAVTPEPLPEAYVSLLFALGDAETARLVRGGASYADLDD